MSLRGRNITRREAEYKSVRAKAHKEQTLYIDALCEHEAIPRWRLGAVISANKKRHVRSDAPGKVERPLETRRKAGDHASAAAMSASGSRFSEFGEGSSCASDSLSCAGDSDAGWSNRGRPTLDDIPKKVARKKGLRKEYEFVENLNRVVVLGDSDAGDSRAGPRSNLGLLGDDEDWEEVYSASRDAARSYSSVLRGAGYG
ncbi:hypothetical protein FA15DRAFT_671080 [Coprinopsis marcescibilis]|uniref:Uncharacterized protein n=1 Tax=Coprinopsis marcescibilis TaxID=230819 RepID=A0A5C3KSN3_COPMA|nr:hypothetical protein FA15DRAFT_671080 [Coprinopsis marcescibilis]